jgi:hypothetical protein
MPEHVLCGQAGAMRGNTHPRIPDGFNLKDIVKPGKAVELDAETIEHVETFSRLSWLAMVAKPALSEQKIVTHS